MTVLYTDPAKILGIVYDLPNPRMGVPSRMTVSGYGNELPTPYRVKLDDNRWRRVYVINYGNAGSAYVKSRGHRLFLDTSTEYALSEGVRSKELVNL